jgi:hypothetical protein
VEKGLCGHDPGIRRPRLSSRTRAGVKTAARLTLGQRPCQTVVVGADFLSPVWKGGGLLAARKHPWAVILSGAKDLALNIFKAMPDSSSPTAPQNDSADQFFRSLFSAAVTMLS